MTTRKRNDASVAWRQARPKVRSGDYLTAYAERRLELEVAGMVHTLRQKRGMTQAELARLAGTRQSAIARLEGCGENITLSRLQKIASVLGAEVKIELRT